MFFGTYKAATWDPEKYDLLRARMGGWSEIPRIRRSTRGDFLRRPDPVTA